jgi:hypothetical protein
LLDEAFHVADAAVIGRFMVGFFLVVAAIFPRLAFQIIVAVDLVQEQDLSLRLTVISARRFWRASGSTN